ncbi:MAG: hypothetical protein IT321_24495 [Anaerolineae bacterium]|nr:hypothetical protein [Anaerolineae bacterium]
MHRYSLILIVLTAICLLPMSASAQQPTTVPGCPTLGDLPTRLKPGMWAKTVAGFTINRRAEPDLQSARTGQIPNGDILRVADGPRCADGYVWWLLNYDSMMGWTAEGDAQSGDYWLEGVGKIAEPAADSDEPDGCLQPPEIYDRLQINSFASVNLRTLAMLDHAQELYSAGGGVIHLRDSIMQGSYNPGAVEASFGTHDGGGALDISVREIGSGILLADEIKPLLHALRLAGFAAYLRDTNELYKGSPIHIHAIAIGDAELSEAARAQIDGTFGYLRGFNALPQDSGIPLPDTSGEMVICDWMKAMGFDDLRGE